MIRIIRDNLEGKVKTLLWSAPTYDPCKIAAPDALSPKVTSETILLSSTTYKFTKLVNYVTFK
jgi:hypothetical protein